MELRVISTPPMHGEMNMSVDLVLADEAGRDGQVILRFYRWNEPTVSMGRTTPDDRAAAAALVFGTKKVVRRPTGGGLVQHGNEMSLSLSWPRRGIPVLRSLRESYCIIHSAIQLGLGDCGIATRMATDEDEDPGPFCHASVMKGDLLSEAGIKVAGGAQRRLANAVLYQGHIWLKGVPMLEDAIAARLARTLGLDAHSDECRAEELAAAETRCKEV